MHDTSRKVMYYTKYTLLFLFHMYLEHMVNKNKLTNKEIILASDEIQPVQ